MNGSDMFGCDSEAAVFNIAARENVFDVHLGLLKQNIVRKTCDVLFLKYLLLVPACCRLKNDYFFVAPIVERSYQRYRIRLHSISSEFSCDKAWALVRILSVVILPVLFQEVLFTD